MRHQVIVATLLSVIVASSCSSGDGGTPPSTTTSGVQSTTTSAVETMSAETTTSTETLAANDIGIAVDIGSTGPGNAVALDETISAVLQGYDMVDMLYSAGTGVVEASIGRDVVSVADGGPGWRGIDRLTLAASSDRPTSDLVAAYRSAIDESTSGYEFTESENIDDGLMTTTLEAVQADAGPDATRWTIEFTRQSSTTSADLVVDVSRSQTVPGPLPEIPPLAQPVLAGAAAVAAEQAWTAEEVVHGIEAEEGGGRRERGSLTWSVSADDTLAASALSMQEAIGTTDIDVKEQSDERIRWTYPNGSRESVFTVDFQDRAGTTAIWNY